MERTRETLVETRSADGFVLEGVVLEPSAAAPRAVVVWTHGVYAAFYAPPGLPVARELAIHGVATVIGNNRGHNVGAWLRNGDGSVLLAGGAWERLADAASDISAWIELARGRFGVARVVLAGHSLGARKALAYVTSVRDDRVVGLILLSPSRRPLPAEDPMRQLAAQMINEGRGGDLLPVSPEQAMSAATYAERADPHHPVAAAFTSDLREPTIASVLMPTLLLLGSDERESHQAAEAELEAIAATATRAPHVATDVLTGANHVYERAEARVAAAISDWLEITVVSR